MKLTELFPNSVKEESFLFEPDDTLPLPSGYVGIEVEVENLPDHYFDEPVPSKYWYAEQEDSLRFGGGEFVTHKIFGKDIRASLDNLTELLDVEYPNAVVSHRCGLHVHLDVSTLTDESLKLFVATYILFEPLLLVLSGHRVDNVFCVPLYQNATILRTLSHGLCSKLPARTVPSTVMAYPKYTSLNLNPIGTLGTVEVRCHEGTVDSERIIRWVSILQCLLAYAQTHTKTTFLPFQMSQLGAKGIVTEVFESRLTYHLPDNYATLLTQGMRAAQDFYRYLQIGGIYDVLLENIMPKGTINEAFCTLTVAHEVLPLENPARQLRREGTFEEEGSPLITDEDD